MKIGIFYGSSTGATEGAAKQVAEELGSDDVLLRDVADATLEEFTSVDVLLCGASTWDIGELQADWDTFLPQLEDVDLSGKIIAFFAMGDPVIYAWNYLDCLGHIWGVLKESNAKLIGLWPTEGYEFDESQGLYDEAHFLGLALDDDNEPEKTEERVKQWVAQVLAELKQLQDPNESNAA